MCSRASRTTAEAVAAEDVEDDIEDSDNNLTDIHQLEAEQVERVLLTVTMTLTMIMMMSAIAATTALIAAPMAEKIAP